MDEQIERVMDRQMDKLIDNWCDTDGQIVRRA